MKIVMLAAAPGVAQIGGGAMPSPWLLATDSALVPAGMPMFLPDWPRQGSAEPGFPYQGVLMLAARIGRLGKNIAPRFVERHVDGWALALRLASPELAPGLLPLLAAGDYGVAAGRWRQACPAETTIDACGERTAAGCLETAALVSGLVADVSRAMTLKSGDMVCAPLPLASLALRPGATLVAQAGGEELLRVRVK